MLFTAKNKILKINIGNNIEKIQQYKGLITGQIADPMFF